MNPDVTRRRFLATTTQAPAAAALVPAVIDIRDFKAAGDGKTDDTAAIQKAVDKAAQTKGNVHIPDGVFCCSTVKLPPNVGLVGNPDLGLRRLCGAGLASLRQLGQLPARLHRRLRRPAGGALPGRRKPRERDPRGAREQARLRQARGRDLHRAVPHRQLHRRRHPPLPDLAVHDPPQHGLLQPGQRPVLPRVGRLRPRQLVLGQPRGRHRRLQRERRRAPSPATASNGTPMADSS